MSVWHSIFLQLNSDNKINKLREHSIKNKSVITSLSLFIASLIVLFANRSNEFGFIKSDLLTTADRSLSFAVLTDFPYACLIIFMYSTVTPPPPPPLPLKKRPTNSHVVFIITCKANSSPTQYIAYTIFHVKLVNNWQIFIGVSCEIYYAYICSNPIEHAEAGSCCYFDTGINILVFFKC